jgi:LemA protein
VKASILGILVLAAFVVLAVSRFANARGDLVAQREAISAEWPQLDEAFETRGELISRLVEMVKGIETNQGAVFEEVDHARAALTSGRGPQDKIEANERLSGALARLLLASENYRKLRLDKSFLRLQDELAAADSQIAIERRKYNELLEHYNAQIQKFPYNLVAGISGFQRNDAYFKTAPGAL